MAIPVLTLEILVQAVGRLTLKTTGVSIRDELTGLPNSDHP